MKVVAVRTDEGTDLEAVRGALTRTLEAEGSVATIHVEPDGEEGDAWRVRVDLGDRRIDYRDPRDGGLASAVIDEVADEGADYALVTGMNPLDVPVIHVGDGSPPAALATIDPTALRDGDATGAVLAAVERVEPHETLQSLIARVTAHPGADAGGAVATFTGRVRADNLEGHTTTHLEYEKYEGVADRELAAIREELLDRPGVIDVRVHHRTGIVEAGEESVYVVALAGHREAAFRACRDGIDRLKERVPIFKKEVTESGEYWAHDRP